jgi:hypothetical protein
MVVMSNFKIIADHGDMLRMECPVGHQFFFCIKDLKDGVIHCRACLEKRPWSEVEKFPNEKDTKTYQESPASL